MRRIDRLEAGQLVHGREGYSKVMVCVHGNKYYGYVSDNDPELNEIDDNDIIEVTDMDENKVACCS